MMIDSSSPDVSEITDYLYISAWPRGDHAEEIRALNVRLILSMHWIKPSVMLGQPPVKLLWLPTFDNPLAPMPIRTLQRGVEIRTAGHRGRLPGAGALPGRDPPQRGDGLLCSNRQGADRRSGDEARCRKKTRRRSAYRVHRAPHLPV